jgi:hypothetical protein
MRMAAFVDPDTAAKDKASLPGRQPHEAAAKEKESRRLRQCHGVELNGPGVECLTRRR